MEVVQRRHGNQDAALRLEEQQLRQKLEEEERVSGRVNDYLKSHYEDLAGQLDYWMAKHEQDVEMKSRDLHDLKVCVYVCLRVCQYVRTSQFLSLQQSKASGLQKLGEFTKQVGDEP